MRSPKAVRQWSSVHGSAVKKPNSFMNVPSTERPSGTPTISTSRAPSRTAAGQRSAPSASRRDWNWPPTVANERRANQPRCRMIPPIATIITTTAKAEIAAKGGVGSLNAL